MTFAQTGIERLALPDNPRRVTMAGTTAWLAIAPPNDRITRVDGTTITPVPLPSGVGVARDIASTPGFLWILTSNAIVRYEISSGSATVMHALTFSSLDRIEAAADGNLWFSRGNAFYRMTPGGTLTQFALPFFANATDIAATTNAIWVVTVPQQFFGASHTTVLRFALDGSVQTVTVPGVVVLAAPGLTSDVWFSGPFGGTLFHLDDAGNVLQASRVPRHEAITVSPDGDVWLAGWSSDVHLIRGGMRTTYAVPNPRTCEGTERVSIDFGTDGRLRILDRRHAAATVPCIGPNPPPSATPTLIILTPSQLPAVAPIPLDPLFADVPVASAFGLMFLAAVLAAGAVYVLHK